MSMEDIPAVLAGSVIIALVLWVNIYEHRRRARMAPEERKREDEETRRETQIW